MLRRAARNGPWVLVAGLVAGLALPGPASLLTPWLRETVVGLLFLAVLQISPRALLGSLADLPRVAAQVLALQLAVPLAVLAVALPAGFGGTPALLALMLMLASPSIMGSPNIALMMGHDPAPALRLMVAGTALLPLTVMPVLWTMAGPGAAPQVAGAALRLFLAIAATGALAMALRHWLMPAPSARTQERLHGASAIALAVFVLGLMPALRETILGSPMRAALWVGFAMAANLGMQLATLGLLRGRVRPGTAATVALVAGNRNMAVMFIALPPDMTAPVLVFLACYQVPMYLTPLVMRRFYPPGHIRPAG